MPVLLSRFPDNSMPSPSARITRPIVTGAGGFVGSALCSRLQEHGRIALSGAHWREALAAVDFRGATVFHLAARVHQRGAREADYEADNTGKTLALAEAAAATGAARFVFASTVKVFGEESRGQPFFEGDEPDPRDAYARSKWQAEKALGAVAQRTALETVVLRIPLTYGRAATGNFRSLVRLADSGWWLPFAAIDNRRSLVHVDDLVEALVLAACHPAAPGRTFVVAHPEAASTPRLVGAIRAALARPARLFRLPPALLEAGASLAGMGSQVRRLTRSLEADPSALIRDLGWAPRFGLEAGIEASLRDWPQGTRA